MEKVITMSTKELARTDIFLKVKEKILTQLEAADLLGLSCRQVRRLFKAYKKQGALALISKKRGKPSNHQLASAMKELALALIQEKYADFGPTLAREKLVEIHHLEISVWSVRRIMIEHNLWQEKKIKKKRVYQLRERRSAEGELEQVDGSAHDWFEGRGPKCTLLQCVDDATGKIKAAQFSTSETTWGYFSLLKVYIEEHGRPKTLYSDRHGVFKVNRSDALSGDGITQFGRAMKELDIDVIFANSPQAKGRIERSNRTLQDRLVKELRLNKISTIEEANAFLPAFIEDYNRRFAVVPKSPHNAHRLLLEGQDLDQIFTIQEFRHLSKNLTFQYKNIIYQVRTERETYAMRKARVMISEKKDGSIEVLYKGKALNFTRYIDQQRQGEVVDSKNLNEMLDRLQNQRTPTYKPSYNHPWKRGARKALFGRTVA